MPDSPIGYTTHYNIAKWSDGSNPGAAGLNTNWDLIDAAIYNATQAAQSYTFNYPLHEISNIVDLLYENNLQLSGEGKLDTIQGIKTTDTPEFSSTKLNSLTASRLIASNASKQLVSTDLHNWVAGTINQVTVTNDGDGSITLSLPQNIHTAAIPEFSSTKLNSLTASRLIASNASKQLVSTDLHNWVAGTINQVTVTNDGDGSITLSLPQDIHTAANTQFNRTIWTDYIGSVNYTSQLTGWRITNEGAGDFRYLFADEMHVKAFIADLEQALAGGQIITKSVAVLYYDFTVPAPGNSANLVVEEFKGFTGKVFENGDYIRLRSITRIDGGLLVYDCWGTVNYVSRNDATKTQAYTFTRSTSPNAGSAATGTIISKGAIVLDYGTAGSGLYEVSTTDGLYGANSPYARILQFTGHPATTQKVLGQYGNLNGAYGYSSKTFGIAVGDYSSVNLTMDNINGFRVRYGSMERVKVSVDGSGFFANNNINWDVNGNAKISNWSIGSAYLSSPTIEDYYGKFHQMHLYASSSKIGAYIEIDKAGTQAYLSYGTILDGYGTETDSYGIAYRSGSNNYFQLSNTQKNISAWNFDHQKIYNNDVRLEATAALKGLGVQSNSFDVLRIGDFTNMSESYLTNFVSGIGSWSLNLNSHSSYYTVTDSSGTYDIIPSNYVFVQVTIKFYKTLPINNVKGKTVKIDFEIKQEENQYGSGPISVLAFVGTDQGDFGLQNVSTTPGSIPTSYTSKSITCPIPSTATDAKLWFYYYYNDDMQVPATLSVRNVTAVTYDRSVVELNKKGLKSFSSPIQSIDLRDGKAEFNVAQLRTSNIIDIGNWRIMSRAYITGSGGISEKLQFQFWDGASYVNKGYLLSTGNDVKLN